MRAKRGSELDVLTKVMALTGGRTSKPILGAPMILDRFPGL